MARIDAGHIGFLVSMWGKGALGASQIAGGIGLALLPAGVFPRFVAWLGNLELVEDPTDPIANWIETLATHLPPTAETFYIVYLILHGALNLGLVLALLAGFRSAYPLSIATLIGFIVYQLWKYSHTSDVLMIVLSVIDAIVILLIWREWRMRHGHLTPPVRP